MQAPATLTVRELETVDEITRAFDLFNRIWGGDEWGAVPVNVMKAMAHARNYVAGAWEDDDLVGASVAFAWGDLAARTLHSHISGVLDASQGRGIGYALKLHQQAWAAERGYERITWTFDPLVRRNAWFNLSKLGARIEEYQPDFYGPMHDGINAGDATDRCLAVWDVHPAGPAGPAGPSGPAGPAAPGSPDGAARRSVEILTCARADVPVVSSGQWAASPALSCQVPGDIIELRQSDPALALRWRHALRDTMGAAIDAGFVARSFTRDGCYILERNSGEDRSG